MYKIFSLLTLIILVTSCEKKIDDVSSATWKLDDSDLVVAVETLNITKGDIYPPIQASGVISGIREAFIVSETRGIIEDVNFEIGDIVSESKVLLNVDDTISKLSMDQAKQQYDSALLDLTSIESFYENGSASLVQLTRARSSANGAKAFYETSLKTYEDNNITSPISGAVAWKDQSITLGNYLNQGTKIARIVDMSSIRVELSLGERQIGLVELGAEAKISISSLNNNTPISGYVVAIAGGSDLSTGSFTVIVEAKNSYSEILRSGMSSSVVIQSKALEPEFIVPTDSIVQREGKDYLFIDRDGVAEPLEVSRGQVIGNRTVIENDVIDDELLIISGLSSIKPGIKVKSRTVGKSGDWL
jgi:membrane fusion protein (multidrug efflux system)